MVLFLSEDILISDFSLFKILSENQMLKAKSIDIELNMCKTEQNVRETRSDLNRTNRYQTKIKYRTGQFNIQ